MRTPTASPTSTKRAGTATDGRALPVRRAGLGHMATRPLRPADGVRWATLGQQQDQNQPITVVTRNSSKRALTCGFVESRRQSMIVFRPSGGGGVGSRPTGGTLWAPLERGLDCGLALARSSARSVGSAGLQHGNRRRARGVVRRSRASRLPSSARRQRLAQLLAEALMAAMMASTSRCRDSLPAATML